MAGTSYLNQLILMDHETGKANSPPKLLKLENYFQWKGRFESYCRLMDVRMWNSITIGYEAPQVEDKGVIRNYTFTELTADGKKEYEAESKALGSIKMALQSDILHLFDKYVTSKSLWDALKTHCEGDEVLKKNRKNMLKKQYYVFSRITNETLDELLTRYNHLLTELAYFEYTPDPQDVKEKLLEALPDRWESFVMTIQENPSFSTWTLEQVISKLRSQDMKWKMKVAGNDFVQKPELYRGGVPTATSKSSSGGITAFYSGESEHQNPVLVDERNTGYFSTPSSTKPETNPTSSSTHALKSMSMSVKDAENQLGVLASFVAAHENYIGGKVTDPALVSEDYKQLDPEDLEEMDIQWQLAMMTIRVQRFMDKTGKKFVSGKPGFDKTKVKCYNCDGFGHFARECQRPRRDDQSASGRQNFNQGGNTPVTSSSGRANFNHNQNSPTSNNQSSGRTDTSRALVVQNQDGGYDWSKSAEDDVSRAYIAEIYEANMADTVDEVVEEVVDYSFISNNDDSFPSNADELAEDENAVTLPTNEEKIEDKNVSSEEMQVQIPDNLSIDDLVSYMAGLNAPEQKVSLSLSSLVNICNSHLKLANVVNELKLEVSLKDSLVNSATNDKSTLSSQVAILKDREKNLKLKVKSDEKHLAALETEFKQLMARKQLGDEAFEKLTIDFAEKQKELADAKVEICSLTGKINQMRDIRFMMNHISESRRNGNYKSFEQTFESLGYQEVAPPLNANYDPKIKIASDSDETDSELSETSKSEGVQTEQTNNVTGQNVKSENNSKLNQTSAEQTSKYLNMSNFRSGGFVHTESVVSNLSPAEFAAMKLKDKITEPSVTPATPIKPVAKDKQVTVDTKSNDKPTVTKKQFENRSCFTCHQKGHVASCCPNKKGSKSKDQQSIDNCSNQGSITSSVLSQDSSEKKTDKVFKIGSGKGISFESNTGHSDKLSKNAHVQFRAKTPNRLVQPRSISPREHSNGKSIRPDQRYTTPKRTTTQTSVPQQIYRPTTSSGSTQIPYQYRNQPQRQSNMVRPQVSPIRRPSTHSFQRSHTPGRRPSGSQSTQGPSAPSSSKGFWTEMTFKDENGKPKTVMAWVPHNN